ncbi:MAG: hypothetical protein ACK58J_09770, partial [Planctomyces sp.]
PAHPSHKSLPVALVFFGPLVSREPAKPRGKMRNGTVLKSAALRQAAGERQRSARKKTAR